MVEKLHQEAGRLLTPTPGSCLGTVAASTEEGARGHNKKALIYDSGKEKILKHLVSVE